MTYETAIVIILTALAALLGALAIGIGLFAIIGYVSLRDGVKDAATKHVTKTMDLTMKAYPEPARMFELTARMEAVLGDWDQVKNQILTGPAPKEVALASNSGIEHSTRVAPPYPGEGAQNVSPAPTNPANAATSSTPSDTDADHR